MIGKQSMQLYGALCVPRLRAAARSMAFGKASLQPCKMDMSLRQHRFRRTAIGQVNHHTGEGKWMTLSL